jgi:hypothetical protein
MPNGHHWGWNPRAISIESAPGSDTVLSISHPASPFFVPWAHGTGEAALQALLRIPTAYYRMIAGPFGLPAAVTDAGVFRINENEPRLKVTWKSIGSYEYPDFDTTFQDPRSSFWVRRRTHDMTERSIVFVAVPCLDSSDEDSEIGSRLGLRIYARVLERQGQDWLVGITGASCSSGLPELLGPAGPEISPDLAHFLGDAGDQGFKSVAKARLRAVSGLAPDADILLEGFRPLTGNGSETLADIFASIPRSPDDPYGPAYAMTARGTIRATGDVIVESVRKYPLTAHQHIQENLFEQDPASVAGLHTITDARANRSPEELSAFTEPCNVPGLAAGNPVTLSDDLGQVEVRESELLGGDPATQKQIYLPLDGDPRTDDFAALSSYMHARLLFDRMRNYGLSPDEYFKFAKFPLIVRYRATISPGPGKDGRTVNAAVDYDPPSSEFGQPKDELQDLRKPLQVRFALGDLRRSLSSREPLGVATDPRWAWHEFGHVLLAARTGGLELPFVHSVGDALAAIACDPESRLATYQGGRFRGLTFPWAHISRRHDRAASMGWSWSGTFHRQGRMPDYTNNRQRKGYQSEQILSSSLFRLYRCLGGETLLPPDANNDRFPDTAARLRAADYVIYLVLKAMEAFPPASAGSIESPLQFADALIRADCDTLPEADPALPLYNRVGGWARKVIEWAFETQGLSRVLDDDAVNDRPGEPPEVDVFIPNLRPIAEGAAGGYMPVSLDWHGAGPLTAEPSWLARQPDGIRIRNRRVRITVHNRGTSQADNVQVRAWYARWNAGAPPWAPAAWANPNHPTWVELNGPNEQRDIPAGGFRRFSYSTDQLPNQPGRYLVLAAALCAADEPNINAAAYPELPTAVNPTPLIDLVAGDNNLGVAIYDV